MLLASASSLIMRKNFLLLNSDKTVIVMWACRSTFSKVADFALELDGVTLDIA